MTVCTLSAGGMDVEYMRTIEPLDETAASHTRQR